MHHEPSIQDRFAPHGLCFGCGPNSDGGLHLRSYVAPAGDVVVARWRPKAQHSNAASPDARGVLNGGIIGTLLDCHTAAAVIYESWKRDGRWPYLEGPGWVTASYSVRFRRPVPLEAAVDLRAWVEDMDEHSARARGELLVDGEVCSTCESDWRPMPPT